jgi:hypothetical protein
MRVNKNLKSRPLQNSRFRRFSGESIEKKDFFNALKFRFISLLIIAAAASSSLSCSSIGKFYPKEKLAQELERICRQEYKLDVKAQLIGGTLAGYLTLDYIYPEKITYKVGSDLKNQITMLMYKYRKLDDKVERALNNFLIATTRVALSTDAKVVFFEAIILDKLNGMERIYIGNITDTKRLKYEDISLAEGGKRIIYDTRLNPKIVGESIIREFFLDMQNKTSGEVIKKYFLRTKEEDFLNRFFFDFLIENDYKNDKVFRLDKLDAARISRDRALIKCEVWQSFTPKEGFEGYTFKFPRFFRNEYIFLINTANQTPVIEKSVILFQSTPGGSIERISLDENILQYLSAPENDLFFEEIKFPDFLASQIAQRIFYEFNLHRNMQKDFYSGYAKGEFLPSLTDTVLGANQGELYSKGTFKFMVDISEKKLLDFASLFEMTLKKSRQNKGFSDPFTMALENFLEKLSASGKKHYYSKKDINILVFKIIADILYSYDFKDFDKIEVINSAYLERSVIDRKDLMDFRKKIKLR